MKDLGEYWVTNYIVLLFCMISLVLAGKTDVLWESYILSITASIILIVQMNFLFRNTNFANAKEDSE